MGREQSGSECDRDLDDLLKQRTRLARFISRRGLEIESGNGDRVWKLATLMRVLVWHVPMLAFVLALTWTLLSRQVGLVLLVACLSLAYVPLVLVASSIMHRVAVRCGKRQSDADFAAELLRTLDVPENWDGLPLICAIRRSIARGHCVPSDVLLASDSVVSLARFGFETHPLAIEFAEETLRELGIPVEAERFATVLRDLGLPVWRVSDLIRITTSAVGVVAPLGKPGTRVVPRTECSESRPAG